MLAGCGSSGSANSLTLYSGQHVQTTAALVQAFEKATGITVNTRSADEDTLAAQISTEGANSPADVFYTENSPALEYLQGKGLLSPVLPSTLAKVPAKYSSPQGDWVGVSARVSVIVYNPSLISASALPTSVMQLAGAAYKGKLALAPAETDFQPVVTSVAKTYGDAAAVAGSRASRRTPAAASTPTTRPSSTRSTAAAPPSGSSTSTTGTGSGTRSARPTCTPRSRSWRRTTPATSSTSPAPAILKSSSHQANAQRFLAFLVSPQAQQIIAHSESYEYPLAPGVAASAKAGAARAAAAELDHDRRPGRRRERRFPCCGRRVCCESMGRHDPRTSPPSPMATVAAGPARRTGRRRDRPRSSGSAAGSRR